MVMYLLASSGLQVVENTVIGISSRLQKYSIKLNPIKRLISFLTSRINAEEEGSSRKRRNTGGDATKFLMKKLEIDRVMKEREFELRMGELERKRHEDNRRQEKEDREEERRREEEERRREREEREEERRRRDEERRREKEERDEERRRRDEAERERRFELLQQQILQQNQMLMMLMKNKKQD